MASKLGSVSAFAIPELITSINAFTLGAQSVNPDVEVSVVWVNTWFDPAKEQEAAKALIAQGLVAIDGQTELRNCATTLSRYYVATPTTISQVFSSIAGNITKLRLTQ